jgi:hypothetical protein
MRVTTNTDATSVAFAYRSAKNEGHGLLVETQGPERRAEEYAIAVDAEGVLYIVGDADPQGDWGIPFQNVLRSATALRGAGSTYDRTLRARNTARGLEGALGLALRCKIKRLDVRRAVEKAWDNTIMALALLDDILLMEADFDAFRVSECGDGPSESPDTYHDDFDCR